MAGSTKKIIVREFGMRMKEEASLAEDGAVVDGDVK